MCSNNYFRSHKFGRERGRHTQEELEVGGKGRNDVNTVLMSKILKIIKLFKFKARMHKHLIKKTKIQKLYVIIRFKYQ